MTSKKDAQAALSLAKERFGHVDVGTAVAIKTYDFEKNQDLGGLPASSQCNLIGTFNVIHLVAIAMG